MGKLFYYTRRVSIDDPSGELTAGGKPVQKIIEVQDCFNVDNVNRGHWASEQVFIVMLNDGHEESKETRKPVMKDNKIVSYEVKRERDWYISQIELFGEDIQRFRSLTELV